MRSWGLRCEVLREGPASQRGMSQPPPSVPQAVWLLLLLALAFCLLHRLLVLAEGEAGRGV